MRPGETITRRNLPHWYVPGTAHFVTYRLADTIPPSRLKEWRDRRERLKLCGPQTGPAAQQLRHKLHKQFFAAYDDYLDTQSARRWLADPRIATVIRDNLYHHNGVKYELLAWCVMPNHVHVLLQPLECPH